MAKAVSGLEKLLRDLKIIKKPAKKSHLLRDGLLAAGLGSALYAASPASVKRTANDIAQSTYLLPKELYDNNLQNKLVQKNISNAPKDNSNTSIISQRGNLELKK